MRTPLGLFLILFFCAVLANAQDTQSTAAPSAASADADTVALRAISAFSSLPVTSIHLSGTAHAVAGSSDERGTFNFDINKDGSSTLRVDAGRLTRTETQGVFGDDPSCSWAGADGVEHEIAVHNCWLALSWMAPSFALQSRYAELDKQVTADSNGQPAATQTVEFSRTVSRARGAMQDLLKN